jgi:hypothetical protein
MLRPQRVDKPLCLIGIFIMEKFKDIIGYEGLYQISNLGNVKTLKKIINRGDKMKTYFRKEKMLKLTMNKSGYWYVNLSCNDVSKRISIHRLVAINFIDNLENKPQVNHINGIRTDNRVENLEWCSASENVKHSYTVLKRVPSPLGKFGANSNVSKSVSQYDLNKNFINKFVSQKDAAKKTGTNNQCISLCFKGKIKTAGGFTWK